MATTETFQEYISTADAGAIKIVRATEFRFTAIVSGVNEETFETHAYPGVYIDPLNNTYYVKGPKTNYAEGEQRTILHSGTWLVYKEFSLRPEVVDNSTFASYYKAVPARMKSYTRLDAKNKNVSQDSYNVRAYQVQPYPEDYAKQVAWAKDHPGLNGYRHGDSISINTGVVEVDVQPGDWVVFHYKRLNKIMHDAHFRRYYEVPDECTTGSVYIEQPKPYKFPLTGLAKEIDDVRNSPIEKKCLTLSEFASTADIQRAINYLEALKAMTWLKNEAQNA